MVNVEGVVDTVNSTRLLQEAALSVDAISQPEQRMALRSLGAEQPEYVCLEGDRLDASFGGLGGTKDARPVGAALIDFIQERGLRISLRRPGLLDDTSFEHWEAADQRFRRDFDPTKVNENRGIRDYSQGNIVLEDPDTGTALLSCEGVSPNSYGIVVEKAPEAPAGFEFPLGEFVNYLEWNITPG